ncbi:hypothetical protein VNO77_16549 [Canavalia gladiata]|uniref:Uncharacterized protein n=1 Tax=Canavalia gladiata TaxID=3824 RepID=A0AAN9QWQ6_CANGL
MFLSILFEINNKKFHVLFLFLYWITDLSVIMRGRSWEKMVFWSHCNVEFLNRMDLHCNSACIDIKAHVLFKVHMEFMTV